MSLKHAILGFLSFYDLSGYDLKKAIDQSIQHFWPADQSQIYRTLTQLERDAFVTKEVVHREDRLDRKVYMITETGRKEIHQWLSKPLPHADSREPFLIQFYFGGKLSDQELMNLLEHELQNAEEMLAVFSAIYQAVQHNLDQSPDQRSAFCAFLTLEYGIQQAVVHRDWVKKAYERIKNQSYLPQSFDQLTQGETNA